MANKTEKKLQVCIYKYLMKKGNNETARAFVQETGLTSEDLEIDPGPNYIEDWWNCFSAKYFFQRSTSTTNSVPEFDQQHVITIPDSDMAFVSSVINSDPLLSYPSSAWNQIHPTPQEDFANNQNTQVGFERPNPLNLGTQFLFSNTCFYQQSTSTTSMLSSAAEPEDQRALTMQNPNMAFVDNYIDLDLCYPSSGQNQILPSPQNFGNLMTMNSSSSAFDQQRALTMPNPNTVFVGNFINYDPCYPSSAHNQILRSPQNFGTPGDRAQSNLMLMNSSSSAFDQQRALTMPNPNTVFVGNFINYDPCYPSSAHNQILRSPQNFGTPGDRAQSNLMLMNSSSSAIREKGISLRKLITILKNFYINVTPFLLTKVPSVIISSRTKGKIFNKQILNAISQRLNTEKGKTVTEPAGTGEAILKKIKSANNRSSLQEIQKLKGKLICCDFSSDGKILACISKEKTVWLWSMKDYSFVSTPIRSFHPCVRNVRFAPSSSHLAAYNSNKTVELWDAINPIDPLWIFSLQKPLTSMDFNPRNINQLCCADNYEIRLWNVNERTSEVLFKGGAREVRFQPGDRNMLAAMSNRYEIRLFDVETKSIVQLLKGHGKRPLTICWDISGRYIASVSQDEALIWSVYDCIQPTYKIRSTAQPFLSCTPHPKYSQAFVIGSYQSLEVWNPSVSNGTESVNAHSGHVYAICSSFQAGLIASTSDDNCLKLWK